MSEGETLIDILIAEMGSKRIIDCEMIQITHNSRLYLHEKKGNLFHAVFVEFLSGECWADDDKVVEVFRMKGFFDGPRHIWFYTEEGSDGYGYYPEIPALCEALRVVDERMRKIARHYKPEELIAVCPRTDEVSDDGSFEETETECDHCEKDMIVVQHISVSYSTRKKAPQS